MSVIKKLEEAGMVQNGLYLYFPFRDIEMPRIEVSDFGSNTVVNITKNEDVVHILLSPRGRILRMEGFLGAICSEHLRAKILDALSLDEPSKAIVQKFEAITSYLILQGFRYNNPYLSIWKEEFPYGATQKLTGSHVFLCFREGQIYANLYGFIRYGFEEIHGAAMLSKDGMTEENLSFFPELKEMAENIKPFLI